MSQMENVTQERDIAESVIETAQAIILVLDPHGRVVRFNPYMEAISGYILEEVKGKDWFTQFIPPVDQQCIRGLFLNAIRGNKTKGNVNTIITKQGKTRSIEWYDTPLKDPDGATVGLLAIGQDITERIEIEKSLEIKDAALESTQEAVAVASLEGELIYVNRAFLDLWGYHSVNEVYGKHSTNFWHNTSDAAQVIELLAETGRWKGELSAVRNDGSLFAADVSANMVIDKDGKSIGLMSIFADITERKQSEQALIQAKEKAEKASEALKKSEEQYRALFNTALDAILVASNNGRYEHANPAACDLFGYTLEELLSKTVWDITVAEEQSRAKSLWRDFLTEGTQSGEYMIRQKDDSIVEVEYRAVANFVPGLHLVVLRDISERKAAERALIVAKEQAEQASEAKSLFLSRMSHELRTPLNSILGFAQLLDRDVTLGHEQKDMLKHVLTSGNHLLVLIRDLLDLTKIERNKLEISMENLDAAKLIRDCIAAMQPLAAQRNISIRYDLSQFRDIFVQGDKIRLKQVLLNLLSNAVKYNKAAGDITISGEQLTAGRFTINVSDTGSGIPQEYFPTLFEPFSRLYLKTYSAEGSGIGLALSKQLVELMDGEMGLRSEIGKGSTFWVELTLSPSPAFAERKPADEAVDREGAGTHLQNAFKLLYIEDSPSHIRLVEEIFTRENGVQMLSANTPRLGLELARAHNPDVILLDICLPDMDGYQVFAQLLADETTRHIPVIALSAGAMPHEIEKGLRCGFRRYLTKPIVVSELLQAVKDVLRDSETLGR